MDPTIAGLGGVGVWSRELRYNSDRAAVRDAATELEELGYTSLFIPDAGGDPLGVADELLSVTGSITVATGILNIWMHEPAQVVREYRALRARRADRFVLGIGNSHATIVDADEPGRYRRPVSRMIAYLDDLAAAGLDTKEEVILGALGPRMLELSGTRAAGAHPYLVTVDYLREARRILGDGRLLAPELGVVLEADPEVARARGRDHVSGYLELPNYLTNLQRLGYGDDDFADGGSDRLIDDIVAWGTPEAVRERIDAYLAAGADHVCVQMLNVPDEHLPLTDWRRLAEVL
ncbi:TIGR03620 family F420-dependent LLM class oxidoreductase [Microbacterium sp.]|uniref:TIGR03620 family F420-dependent LLM class oxidoreductase n=1 Tax=Microbacterium sp. TaxID=51671 RepID=UPI000925B14D|nr:TIGR03620 family F420-dependent LLM class oxidoreductase [Microbacterium sp.]MBN9193779.1 TIGR03620 family F420-dependent LLM class oxidoreductase [Microbacterium sp.]OJU66300.1 MAG: LLM class F420-dependent oxidoreductase [Microbacterium sp. 70-38]